MPPSSRPLALLRVLSRAAVVVLLMATALMSLVLATMTSPTLTDPVTAELTAQGTTRGALAMLLVLALPFYRIAPSVLLIVGTVSILLLHLDPFLLAVGLTVWIARAQRGWQWAIAGTGLMMIVANGVMHIVRLHQWPDEEYRLTGQLLVAFTVLGCLSLVLALGFWARARRSTRKAEADADSAQRTSEHLTDELTRQREREDLAREVHDTLASRLSVLSLHAGSLQETAQREGEARLQQELQTTRNYADQALTDLRVLLTSLREGGAPPSTPVPPPQGIDDLGDLLDDAAATGLEVHSIVALDGYTSTSAPLQRTVLRITQEALTNALRHSPDRVVRVRITGSPASGIRMVFRNRRAESSGFSLGSGTGLMSIRERAEMVGGTVDVQEDGDEFILTVHLPEVVDDDEPVRS